MLGSDPLDAAPDQEVGPPRSPEWIELLPDRADLRRQGQGDWSVEEGQAIVRTRPDEGWSRLTLPVETTPRLDFLIEFTCLEGSGSIDQYVPIGSTFAVWSMWCRDYTRLAFVVDRASFEAPLPPALELGLPERVMIRRRYRSIVAVRPGRLRAIVDGRPILDRPIEARPAANDWPGPRIPSPDAVGVGAYRSTVRFHRLAVRFHEDR